MSGAPWEIDDRPPWEVDDAQAASIPPFLARQGQGWTPQGAVAAMQDQPQDQTPSGGAFGMPQPAPVAPRSYGDIGRDFVSGAVREAPLVALRAANMPGEIARGAVDYGAQALGVPQAARDRAAQAASAVPNWLESQLGAEPGATTAESVGRGVTRALPQVALGVATGGASLPAQVGLGVLAQGAQTASEGGSPQEVATSAALAGAGQGVGGLVGKAVRPFAKSFNRAAMEAADRLGISLPGSAMTDSGLAQNIEALASKSIGGGRAGQRAVTAAEDLSGLGREIASGANPDAAGLALAQDYATTRAGLQQAKNAAYGQIGDLTKLPANPQETLGQIDAMLAEGTAAPDVLANLRRLREAIAPKVATSFEIGGKPVSEEMNVTLRQMAEQDPNMLKAIGAKVVETQNPRSVSDIISQQAGLDYGGPNALQDAALSNRLRASLGQDIDAALAAKSPEQLIARNVAKTAYRDYAQLSNSSFGRRISKMAEQGQYDRIAGIVKSSESSNEIGRMVQVMQPETLDQIRANVMASMVKQAAPAGTFSPQALERVIRSWGPTKLRMVLAPEQLQKLQDIATVANALGKSTRVTGGSQTAYLARMAAYAGGMFVNPILTLKAMLGEAAFGTFISSEAGRKWLTSGVLPNAGRITSGLGRAGASAIPDYAADVERARREQQMRRQNLGPY